MHFVNTYKPNGILYNKSNGSSWQRCMREQQTIELEFLNQLADATSSTPELRRELLMELRILGIDALLWNNNTTFSKEDDSHATSSMEPHIRTYFETMANQCADATNASKTSSSKFKAGSKNHLLEKCPVSRPHEPSGRLSYTNNRSLDPYYSNGLRSRLRVLSKEETKKNEKSWRNICIFSIRGCTHPCTESWHGMAWRAALGSGVEEIMETHALSTCR
jgi:hypothetical protein